MDRYISCRDGSNHRERHSNSIYKHLDFYRTRFQVCWSWFLEHDITSQCICWYKDNKLYHCNIQFNDVVRRMVKICETSDRKCFHLYLLLIRTAILMKEVILIPFTRIIRFILICILIAFTVQLLRMQVNRWLWINCGITFGPIADF